MAIVFEQPLEQKQWTLVSHRMRYSWRMGYQRYEGRRYLVERPADGAPARRWSVRCPVCGRALNYTVQSVAATRRRVVVGLVGGCVAFGISVVSMVLALVLIDVTDDMASFLIGVSAVGMGAVLPLSFTTQRQRGFVGHGASLPTFPPHDVRLVTKDGPVPPVVYQL
ncbi:hypothetical protein [Actinomadura terrae]|uniref:hypothetical protein n=1 Tax=Actinomadura terrae TaxID=604353 RepID=UPI001FA6F53A|nr:hypothetical protein [Actinomadura terrae]